MSEKITELISEEKIEKRIRELAEQISADYDGKGRSQAGRHPERLMSFHVRACKAHDDSGFD